MFLCKQHFVIESIQFFAMLIFCSHYSDDYKVDILITLKANSTQTVNQSFCIAFIFHVVTQRRALQTSYIHALV